MYGERLRFVVTGLGIQHITPADFDAALARIPAAAQTLAAAGAQAIELTGTSLTFYRGEAFNRKLRATVTNASGLPSKYHFRTADWTLDESAGVHFSDELADDRIASEVLVDDLDAVSGLATIWIAGVDARLRRRARGARNLHGLAGRDLRQ